MVTCGRAFKRFFMQHWILAISSPAHCSPTVQFDPGSIHTINAEPYVCRDRVNSLIKGISSVHENAPIGAIETTLKPLSCIAFKPKEKESKDNVEKNERSSRYDRDQSKPGRDASGNNYNHNVRETPPRFQKLQAQKQAQRQMGDTQQGSKDNRGGRRGDRPERFDDRRRDGKKSNEWTNDKEDASQGFKNESRFKNERRDGGYQDRNERRFDGQSRSGVADDQNDRGYQGRDRNNRSDKFQSERGRSSQNDGYQNDNGYQGRSNRRFDGQGKSGDTSRYNSNKNDNNTEKTYRLMERKKDNGPAQEENQSTKRSNGREAPQQDGIGNWKGPGQEENAKVKNQVNIRPDFKMLSQQSQPFIPQQQQQQMVSDGGRRVTDAGANQALNQGSVVRTKVMTNGPEMIPQSQSIPMLPFKVDDHCLSKYWEDHKFYKAQITAIHPSGKTCMVKFVEYGNFEEVLITDIMPCADHPWTAPPPSIAPVHHQQQQQPPHIYHQTKKSCQCTQKKTVIPQAPMYRNP
eukprot:XP_011674757.1 PREDICTED: stress protein DDR48-like [Strongylocentrotus purpuratus]